MKMTIGRAFLSLIIALSVATPAFAQTTDSSAQIESLRAQIKDLQAQLGQVLGVQTPACPSLTRSLTLGSSGRDVTSLQTYLIAKGYLNARYATGYYGFITAQAVGRFQLNMQVVSSSEDEAFGILGPLTRSAILRDCGGSSTATNTTTTTTPTTPTTPTRSFTEPSGGASAVPTAGTSRSTPTIRASTVSLTQNNVAIEYTNIPSSNRILFLNASTKATYGSPSAVISLGGNGATTIPLPDSLPSGNYFLRVVQYYSPSTIIVSSNGFFVGERTQTSAGTAAASGTINGGTFTTQNPTITGTVTNGGQNVGFSVLQGDKVYGSGNLGVTNGSWSHRVTTSLSAGSYTVELYSDNVKIASAGITIPIAATATAPDGTSFSSLPTCPSNAVDKRGRDGEQFYCSCPANFTVRGIWGGGTVNRNYTDDSDICTAAAHSGQFSPANGGTVYYTIKAGASSYPVWQGANGINSSPWGSWYGSFWITGPKG